MKQKNLPVLLAGLVSGCVVLLAGCRYVSDPGLPFYRDSVPCVLSVDVFETPEEMLKYFSSEFHSDDSDRPAPNLFLLKDSIAGLELDFVKVSGAHIYYEYIPESPEQNTQPYSVEEKQVASIGEVVVSSEPNSYNNEIQRQMDEGSYIPEDSFYFFDYISIGWNYNGKGSYGLGEFVSKNSGQVKELPGYSGFYYSDCVSARGTLYGKMLYWVHDDCFFKASIPIELYEEALSELTAPVPIMQRVNIEAAGG